jgi:hypothetical protein
MKEEKKIFEVDTDSQSPDQINRTSLFETFLMMSNKESRFAVNNRVFKSIIHETRNHVTRRVV